MENNEDDTLTNLEVYITGWDYDLKGWVIYKQSNGDHVLTDGPWGTQEEAKEELRLLNLSQGVDI